MCRKLQNDSREKDVKPAGTASSSGPILLSIGLALVVVGLLLGFYGVMGLNTPHSCPSDVPNCTTTSFPFQVGSTYTGFSMVVVGSAVLLLRGKITIAKASSFAAIVGLVVFVVTIFGLR